MSEKIIKEIRKEINNYKDTVNAIITFCCLYKYDDKKSRDNVKVFQGRRFLGKENKKVTPDIAIQIENKFGIVAEVKISFPLNQEFWLKDFDQLMSYDYDLINWLANNLKINNHDIFLLVNTEFAKKIEKYYHEQKRLGTVKFNRNFAIIEFWRIEKLDAKFFFRIKYGTIPDHLGLASALDDGISIPLQKIVSRFEEYMLSDDMPPMPYLIFIIHQNFLSDKARQSKDFARKRKNSKIAIKTTSAEISDYLYENFSFKRINSENKDNQPHIPPKTWINKAVDVFVKIKRGEWIDKKTGSCILYFRKMDNLLSLIELCLKYEVESAIPSGQIELFEK